MRPSWTELDDALSQLLAAARPLPDWETLACEHAVGRVLAQPVVSPLAVPPADNSAMDGYALRLSDWPQAAVQCVADSVAPGGQGGQDPRPLQLPISQRIAAGDAPQPLAPRTVARIFTGASVPAGADAVQMQELARPSEDGSRVGFAQLPTAGEFIRRAGEDIAQGATVLAAGRRIGVADVGLAASVGERMLCVVRAPRVALISSGNELVEPGAMPASALPAGHIFNSNRYFLQAMLRQLGCSVTDLGVAPDELAASTTLLRQAAESHDVVLSSGGVSVGEEDHLKAAVQALGELKLWQIAMKPGKPFAFGRLMSAEQGAVAESASQTQTQTQAQAQGTEAARAQGKGLAECPAAPAQGAWYLGLPGNPVSSWVCFALLVRPFLLALQGVPAEDLQPWPSLPMRADFSVPQPGKRREFLRVRRNAQGGLDLFANQSSGVLTSVAWADGLVDLPAGTTIAAGQTVRYLPLRELA